MFLAYLVQIGAVIYLKFSYLKFSAPEHQMHHYISNFQKKINNFHLLIKKKTMNIETAKTIKIYDYLASLGHHPIEAESNNKWLIYYSPFREEKYPSFSVKVTGDYYKDFGRDEKAGDIVNLVSRLHNTDIKGALVILEKFELDTNPSKPKFFFYELNKAKAKTKPPTETITIDVINDPELMIYLAIDRAIPAKVWQTVPELCQVVLSPMIPGSMVKYNNIAFRNDQGGFELRNRNFKGSTAPKTITTIQSEQNDKLTIFEGFMDYLSFIAHYGRKPKTKTIVLNSLSNLHKIENTLINYSEVNLFLDNDIMGETAANKIISTHKKAVNWSKILYPDYDDFNGFLWSKQAHINLVKGYEASK